MLQKIFFNPDRTVVFFAKEANIPGSMIATLVRSYKKKNGKILANTKKEARLLEIVQSCQIVMK